MKPEEVLASLNAIVADAELETLTALAAGLSAAAAHAAARCLQAAQNKRPPEEWLLPREAAALLKTSEKSLYRRWRRLPFCRPAVTGRGFRVNLAALQTFMADEQRRRG